MGGVTITELIDKMGLRNMTPELDDGQCYAGACGCEPSGIAVGWIFRPF